MIEREAQTDREEEREEGIEVRGEGHPAILRLTCPEEVFRGAFPQLLYSLLLLGPLQHQPAVIQVSAQAQRLKCFLWRTIATEELLSFDYSYDYNIRLI